MIEYVFKTVEQMSGAEVDEASPLSQRLSSLRDQDSRRRGYYVMM